MPATPNIVPTPHQGPKSLVKHLLTVEPVGTEPEPAGTSYFKPQTEVPSVARPAAAIPMGLPQCVSRKS